jgi:hypothetical protein
MRRTLPAVLPAVLCAWTLLTRRLSWDAALYFYGRMPEINTPSNLRVDTRLEWRFGEHIGFSFGIQNALRPAQAEFFESRLTEVQRNVFGGFRWSF